MQYQIRHATLADKAELEALIARSARELSTADYTPAQIEGALRGAFGVDTQLILDGTYFVADCAGKLIACGGWSRRRTLFGGDAGAQRDAGELDPSVDAARIRAFFVDAAYARQGLGSALLQRCEAEALARGYSRFELMATLPGVPLYAARGYVPGSPLRFPLAGSTESEEFSIEFVPMRKAL
jgi:GNAT superfamily N-acetyltransferase